MERLMYYFGTDRQFIRYWFKAKMGYYPDLDNPKTYNEKLQWLKLYYRKPILTSLVDKYAVKKFVAEQIGDEYIIPTLGVWNNFDDIDFNSLPNKFVLKCTHDSGGLVICKDKSRLDKEAAKKKIENSLKTDFYKLGREWPYKNVPRRIIAEEYMEEITKPETKDLEAYKFFCHNGNPICCQVTKNNGVRNEHDTFDMTWDSFANERDNTNNYRAVKLDSRPLVLEKMIEIVKQLSKEHSFSRIDIYILSETEWYIEVTVLPVSVVNTNTFEIFKSNINDLKDLKGRCQERYRYLIDKKNTQLLPIVGELRDYKFFCFNGNVKWLFIATERQNRDEPYFDFFDTNFNHLDMRHGHPNAPFNISKPKNFELMIELASKLSIGFPHVRVDFYEVNGQVYFGEMTFFHHTGRVRFDPVDWDTIFGNEIVLPKK